MYLKHIVSAEDDGKIAQRILVNRLGISASMAKEIRLRGELLRNGKHYRMVDPVDTHDVLEIFTEEDYSYLQEYQSSENYTEFRPPSWFRERFTSDRVPIIYQDNFCLVVSKPAGITTHERFPGAPDSLDAYLELETIHPVNRLDRFTSGLVLLALNGYAHYRYVSRDMERSYLALLHGVLPEAEGLIDLPIQKIEDSPIERHVILSGQEARTHYQTLAVWGTDDASLVLFTLDTGRTHQIRVHARALGCPLIGDTLYGINDPQTTGDTSLLSPQRWNPQQAYPIDALIDRQALHAWALSFYHPTTGEKINIHAKLPDDMQHLLESLGRPTTFSPGNDALELLNLWHSESPPE